MKKLQAIHSILRKQTQGHQGLAGQPFLMIAVFVLLLTSCENVRNRIPASSNDQKTCDSRNMEACYNLGHQAYKKGKTIKALRLYQRACDGGHLDGCTSSGLLENQKGNLTKAARLVRKGCNGKNEFGCRILDIWNKTEYKRKSYQRLCDNGDMEKCFELGEIAEKRLNLIKAKEVWQRACDGGFVKGCYELWLGEYYAKGKGNTNGALKLLQRACDGGMMKGCGNLARFEAKKGNIPKAMKIYQRTCNNGYMIGCYSLGQIYSLKGNLEKAVEFYQKACNGGDEDGCYKIREIVRETGRALFEPSKNKPDKIATQTNAREEKSYLGKYTVQLSSHGNLSEAKKFAKGFRVRGYDLIIYPVELPNKGTWYRVCVGVFNSVREAKEFVKRERSLFQRQDYTFARFD